MAALLGPAGGREAEPTASREEDDVVSLTPARCRIEPDATAHAACALCHGALFCSAGAPPSSKAEEAKPKSTFVAGVCSVLVQCQLTIWLPSETERT